MSNWTNTNLACVKTWIHLKTLNQLNDTFENSGSYTMDKLAFWNQDSSPDMRALEAKTICTQLDNLFRLWDKTSYEQGFDTGSAIQSLVNVMIVNTNTVADLAAAADAAYQFKGEA